MPSISIVKLEPKQPLLIGAPELLIPAGFPSPAQDYTQTQIDLNEVLIKDRSATYILTVSGDSMIGAGIADGDEIIVDTSMTARPGKIVVASINGEYTVKRFTIDRQGRGWLMPENPDYPPLKIEDGSEFSIFGVVTRCLHHLA